MEPHGVALHSSAAMQAALAGKSWRYGATDRQAIYETLHQEGGVRCPLGDEAMRSLI
jgi:hypothetical protein